MYTIQYNTESVIRSMSICPCGWLHTRVRNDDVVYICPGNGTAHWCASCCKTGRKCVIHNQTVSNATELFGFIPKAKPSSAGGLCPPGMTWMSYREHVLHTPVVLHNSYHPITQTNAFSKRDSLKDVFSRLPFAESVSAPLSGVCPMRMTVCLKPFYTGDLICTSKLLKLKHLCYLPETDTKKHMRVSIRMGSLELFHARVPLSTTQSTNVWETVPIVPGNVTGTISDDILLCAHFCIHDGAAIRSIEGV